MRFTCFLRTACIDEDALVIQGQSGSEDRQLTARHSRRVSGTGLIFKTWQSLCQFLISCSSDPYIVSNSSFKAILKASRAAIRAAFRARPPFSHSYNLYKRSNSTFGGFEGSYWKFEYCEKKPSSGVSEPRGWALIFLWPGWGLLVRDFHRNYDPRAKSTLRVIPGNLKERTSGLTAGSLYG